MMSDFKKLLECEEGFIKSYWDDFCTLNNIEESSMSIQPQMIGRFYDYLNENIDLEFYEKALPENLKLVYQQRRKKVLKRNLTQENIFAVYLTNIGFEIPLNIL